MAQRRVLWRFWQAHLHPERLVFIDETGAHTKLVRLYGRALRGQRLVAKVPYGHWKTTTFVGALRVGGITAPLVVDGPINGDVFRAYVEQQLVAVLHPGSSSTAGLAPDSMPAVGAMLTSSKSLYQLL